MKINIIYEDNHLLVVEKPINIPVQKDISNDLDFQTILKNYLKEKYQKKNEAYLGTVHRLDRPVGGIMVFAKTSKCAKRLTDQIKNKEFKKEYYAVVLNDINEKGRYEDYLIKDTKKNIVKVSKEGKLACLEFEKKGYENNLSLVKINLETGRSHQIRVQFSYHGNPLYGDHRYNKNVIEKSQIALFAKTITFKHPITKETMTFSLDLPSRYPFNIFTNIDNNKEK